MINSIAVSGQWASNNLFYDSLHLAVNTAPGTQKNPLILRSFPDNGYFVIWEDERTFSTTGTDIYAQKYDNAGNALWAANGVPVANGTNSQRYAFSSNQDYRNRNFAATDSSGGFYITYIDDSINNYSWERITIQHVLNNGTRRFGNIGYILAATPPGLGMTFSAPLLIPDGNKGCFISFIRTENYNNWVYAYDYRDDNGTMNYYGGGIMNENAIQRYASSPCGPRGYIDYPGTTIQDYNIWSDGQGGCNIVMAMNGNSGDQGKMLTYNRLWRAKKNATVRSIVRNTSGVGCPQFTSYTMGTVYPLYSLKFNVINIACGDLAGNIYEIISYNLTSVGYQLLDIGAYDYYYPKGVTVFPENSNINADLIAVTRRTISGNNVSDFTVQGYLYRSEKYDSVPFQRCYNDNPEIGFNPVAPSSLNKLNFFRDTILGNANYYVDFSLAAGGNKIYAASLMGNGPRTVNLQYFTVDNITADSLAFVNKTDTRKGVILGKEISTGFGGSNISYDFPLVAMSSGGDAMFYTREYYRGVRASQIVNGTELKWGAMGRSVGTGAYNGSSYNAEQPVAAVEPYFGKGLITWRDNRALIPASGENIFMQHVDSMLTYATDDYQPPYRLIRALYPNTNTFTNPAVLLGTSKHYSTIDIYGNYGPYPGTCPAFDILDNQNLGIIQGNLFENFTTPRTYNNQLFLDRNFTINTENAPSSGMNLRLFFSQQEFDKMKANDNSINSPADFTVIWQPNTTINVPATYAPVAGEKVLPVYKWAAVAGGYYIEVLTNNVGNFFIEKPGSTSVCPGGNATITSTVTGTTYQWQVNTGGGFINVTDNTNYTGSNTVSLHLNAVPSSWYGYQYRCLVDNVPGAVYALRFTNNWSGSVNNNWEVAANWSCGTVPDANTDVIITAGTIIVNSNISVRSLKLNPGVSFTVKAGFTFTELR